MRLVFVAPFGLGRKSTVWARTLPLARRLVVLGCTVHLIIPPWDTPEDGGREWVDQGVHLVNVSLAGGLPGMLVRMLHRIEHLRPHIVHVVKPRAQAGLVQWFLWQKQVLQPGNRWRGPRLLLDLDDWEQAWSGMGGYSWPVARFLDWQERWGIPHAHAITVASRWLEEKTEQLAPGTPVLYLPNGISPPRGLTEPADLDPEIERVLFFSRFVEVEAAWMSEFWQSLRQYRPGVRLTVAGRALQPGQEAAFRIALQVDCTPVEWLGYVAPRTLDQVYSQATCAIFPAANVPLNQAKCSVRLATTLLRGVPVVASAVGEQANYGAEGAARLLPPDTAPQVFARAVADLLAAPRAQRQLVARAQARLVVEYDWDRLGDRLYAFYGQQLDRARAGP